MRMKSEIDEEKRKITSLYAEIGRMFAHTLTDGNIPKEYRQIYNKIRASEQRIIEIRGRMTAQAAAYDNQMTCPVCHAQIPADSIFCNGCGANLAQAAAQQAGEQNRPQNEQTPGPDFSDVSGGSVCTNCGAPLKEGQIFCINCGSKVAPPPSPRSQNAGMNEKTEIITPETEKVPESLSKCPACGAELSEGQIFCMNCGAKIKE